MSLLPVSRRTGNGAKGFILALGVPHEGGIIHEPAGRCTPLSRKPSIEVPLCNACIRTWID